ncbi:saccharopine dehydrogenase NADP-binding domain-containing protein [candidate division WOR-3 bacterium]|nr:saccharopine dehydrogenase NADP-binding domain-containing protein [candidate division WOR-3 bacterium]
MRFLAIGAGMQARAVAYDLVRQRDVREVTVTDLDPARLRHLKRALGSRKVRTVVADAADRHRMTEMMRRCDVAVSCVPYFFNLGLARAAIASRTHFCDLGGNNDVVRAELALSPQAKKAGVTVVPDCGLAPGMVGILAADGFSRLDRTNEIRIRVGGLPRRPKPPFKYALVFSAHGLINEYAEPCLVLANGRPEWREPLEDMEWLQFPRPYGNLEAFNTSGGSSTLPESFRGRVKKLDYKTVRYMGHCTQMRVLRDLGFMSLQPELVAGKRVVPRQFLAQRLEAVLPRDTYDVVLLRIYVRGAKRACGTTIKYEMTGRGDSKSGLTAMMRATGFSAAIVALMLGRGQVECTGAFTGENCIPTTEFIRELRQRGLHLRIHIY